MREFAAGSKGLSCELSALSMEEGDIHLHTCTLLYSIYLHTYTLACMSRVYRWCRGRQAGAYSGIT